jgi:hypothetical protein
VSSQRPHPTRPRAQVIQPINGDPFVGMLETPVTSSPLVAWYLSNLPAYRTAVSPLLRGVEVGLAHGFLLVGPFIKLGPLRNVEGVAEISGSLSAAALVLILTAALSAYGAVTFQQEVCPAPHRQRGSRPGTGGAAGCRQGPSAPAPALPACVPCPPLPLRARPPAEARGWPQDAVGPQGRRRQPAERRGVSAGCGPGPRRRRRRRCSQHSAARARRPAEI